MINLAQMFVSLFTTSGKINPIALVIFAGTVILGYQHFTLNAKHKELVRQQKIVKEAGDDKVETLNEARNEQEEAREVIDSDRFDNDYLKRLQDLD